MAGFGNVYERPPLYEKQEQAFFNDKRISTCEGGTKSGKTVCAISWLFEKALIDGNKRKNYWWVAPVASQSEIAFRRMKDAIPFRELYSDNKVQQVITLANGARIAFKTGDNPDNLYGEDVYACIIDEASRVKPESWHAVRSTLTATRGPIRMVGNVKGRSNWFYRLCRMAEEGHPDMAYTKLTCYDAAKAGVIDWQEIEDAKKIYPENVFKELYLCEPADDHGNPFGSEYIQRQILIDAEGRPTRDTAKGKPIAWGWDVAKSMNWTVGIGLNKRGEVCEFHRWRDSWDATLKRIIALTGRVPAYVDSTGGGDPVDEILQRHGGTNFRGFKFSRQSKQDLMVLLATGIQQAKLWYPDGRIVEELEAFEYEISPSGNVLYSAPRGVHDDAVDALAMAYKMYNQNTYSQVVVAPQELTRDSPWQLV